MHLQNSIIIEGAVPIPFRSINYQLISLVKSPAHGFWLISFWNSHLILNAKETFSHVPSNKCDTLHLSPQDSWKPKEVDPFGAQSSCSVYCNDMATIWTSCCRFLSTQFFSHQNVLLKRRKNKQLVELCLYPWICVAWAIGPIRELAVPSKPATVQIGNVPENVGPNEIYSVP
jgi:hypothetical protein